MIKKYNLSTPTEYKQKGETKTRWDKVGVLIIMTTEDKDGKDKIWIEIPAIGLKAQAFPFKEKDNLNKNYEKTNTETDFSEVSLSDF